MMLFPRGFFMVVSDSENRRQDTPPSSDTSNYHVRTVLSSSDLGELTNTELVLGEGANPSQVGSLSRNRNQKTTGRY
jgi:hypothetical protein